MFEGLKRRRLENALACEQLEAELAVTRNLRQMMTREGLDDFAQKDEDENDWTLIGQAGGRGLDQMQLQDARGRSRQLVQTVPHAAGVLRCFVRYIIGRGMTPVVQADSNNTLVAVEEQITQFERLNDWDIRQEEYVKRALRDGETFTRFFKSGMDVPAIRFVPPEDVASDDPAMTAGIKTDPQDVQHVEAYSVKRAGDTTGYEEVEAEEIIHTKINVDSDVKRGIPLLYPVETRLKKYEAYLSDKLTLARARQAIVLIRKHLKASPTQIANFAETVKTGTATVKQSAGSGTTTARRQRLRAGTILDTGGATEYEFLSPNVDARDLAVLGREILLSIAAALGLTEHLFTGDASNNNKASIEATLLNTMLEMERWQKFFANEFRKVYVKALHFAQESGAMPEGLEYDLEVMPSAPPIFNPVDIAKKDEVLYMIGVQSATTAAAQWGLDPRQEQENFEKEASRQMAPVEKPMKRAGDEGGEQEEVEEGVDLGLMGE